MRVEHLNFFVNCHPYSYIMLTALIDGYYNLVAIFFFTFFLISLYVAKCAINNCKFQKGNMDCNVNKSLASYLATC